MNSFTLNIITPESVFYSGEIEYLCIDTPDGKSGFMRGALPRVGVLAAGDIDISTPVIKQTARCGPGIYIVDKNGVTVLCERATFGEDIPAAPVDRDGEAAMHEYNAAKAKMASEFKKLKHKENT